MFNFMELLKSAKKLNLATDNTGFKSRLLTYSYMSAFSVMFIIVIFTMIYLVLGGAIKEFVTDVGFLKDFYVSTITGLTGMIGLIATTCMGASMSENMLAKKEEPKSEETA